HQEFGIHVTGVRQVLPRQEILVLEGLMDQRRHVAIRDRPRRRLHLRDEVWCVVLAGLGQVDFVADPSRRVLLGVACLDVLRATDEVACGWNALGLGPPTDLSTREVNLLYPDAPERFDRWHVAQPSGGLGSKERLQQAVTIGADLPSVDLAFVLPG